MSAITLRQLKTGEDGSTRRRVAKRRRHRLLLRFRGTLRVVPRIAVRRRETPRWRGTVAGYGGIPVSMLPLELAPRRKGPWKGLVLAGGASHTQTLRHEWVGGGGRGRFEYRTGPDVHPTSGEQTERAVSFPLYSIQAIRRLKTLKRSIIQY